MRTACRFAFLLAYCVWAIHAQAQSSHSASKVDNNPGNINANESTPIQSTNVRQESQPRNSIWDDPVRFSTKAKDNCTMVISGQGDFTKLQVSCKNKGKSYRCDFLGKPNLCRSYNNNPRHYFTQISWTMRKLQNACQGPQIHKPQMCRAAVDEAQMVFHTSWPKKQPPKVSTTSKPATTPKVLPKVQKTKPVQPRKTIKTTTPRPTAEVESKATKLAEDYCWKSIQGFCSYVISWFQN